MRINVRVLQQISFLALMLPAANAFANMDRLPTGSIAHGLGKATDRPAILAAPVAPTSVKIPADTPILLQYGPSPDPKTQPVIQPPQPAAINPPKTLPQSSEPALPNLPHENAGAIAAALSNANARTQTFPPKGSRATRWIDLKPEHLEEIYAQHNNLPLWRRDGAWSSAALSIITRLRKANRDGLNLAQTPTPDLADSAHGQSEQLHPNQNFATQDVALTRAALNYAWQAAGGRVNPHVISTLILRQPLLPSPNDIIANLQGAGSRAGDVLRAYNPTSHGYQALRDKLAGLLPSQTLQSQIKRPLVTPISILAGNTPNDRLASRRMQPGSGTQIAALGSLNLINHQLTQASIQANMEFWRWMPRDLGTERVEVNIPEFTVRLRLNGNVIDKSRVIVGKPKTPTPLFSNSIQYIVINPYWIVPQSIIRKEFLPKLEQNPDYLAQHGFEVRENGDHLDVRQPPGPRNALGHIKFIFPNSSAVYLHDTDARGLFSAKIRAFSHGCVRLSNPFFMAQNILGGGYSQKRLEAMVGTKQHFLRPPAPVQIHLEYFTTHVDGQGQLQHNDDIYGYERLVTAALRPYN